MFRSLARALDGAGFGAAALFDLHPNQLLATVEAAWEDERARRGLPWPGLAELTPALKGYGTVHTATGRALDTEAVTTAATDALAHFHGPPTLAWAWLVEGSGLVSAMSALVYAELGGASKRLTSDGSRRWLRTCEVVFGGDNLLTLRGALRPSPAKVREGAYRAAFGAPVGAQGVFFNGVEGGFTDLLNAWLAGDDSALAALQGFATAPAGMAREAFAATELVSWFFLSLTLPDSPVAADLGLADRDSAGRLAGLFEALGGAAGDKASALLAAATLLDRLLRGGKEGVELRAALAAVWPGLEGGIDEDPEAGAGGDIGLAFGGEIRLGDPSAFSFGDALQPSVLLISDKDARIRTPPPALAMTSNRFAYGAEVQVTDIYMAEGVYYVKLAPVAGGAAAWTKLANVAVPTNALVGLAQPTDKSQTGPFAMWAGGRFTDFTPLWVFGGTARVGLVTVADKTLAAYMDMLGEAERAGFDLSINSGFRSYPEQKYYWDKYQAGGTLAAKPGTGPHQCGVAIDMDMGMGKGNPSSDVKTWTAIYKWMVKNARRFGFMRTVQSEAWHWEYHPDRAANDDTFTNWTALKKAEGS